jgi:hypothetical protein
MPPSAATASVLASRVPTREFHAPVARDHPERCRACIAHQPERRRSRCVSAHDRPDPTPAAAPGTRPVTRCRAARSAHRMTSPATRAARTRLDPPPAATLTSPRPGPIPPCMGQRDRPDDSGSRHSEFRQPCALNGRRAPPGLCASCRPAAATVITDDPAHRTLNAAPTVSSARFRRPCLHRGQAAGRITRLARRPVRRRRPRRRSGRPRREKAGPGDHSAPPAIPYSFPYTCRHRNPPDPGNAQAVPEINLRVNSQTYIRAQLVKQ